LKRKEPRKYTVLPEPSGREEKNIETETAAI